MNQFYNFYVDDLIAGQIVSSSYMTEHKIDSYLILFIDYKLSKYRAYFCASINYDIL